MKKALSNQEQARLNEIRASRVQIEKQRIEILRQELRTATNAQMLVPQEGKYLPCFARSFSTTLR